MHNSGQPRISGREATSTIYCTHLNKRFCTHLEPQSNFATVVQSSNPTDSWRHSERA
jgi:hypothetical protein